MSALTPCWTRRPLAAAILGVAIAAASGIAMPTTFAASPQIIVPPGFNCPTSIPYPPHVSEHMQQGQERYVITTAGESDGCTDVVSSITLTTYLVLGSLSNGEEVASASTTWTNTAAEGYMTNASLPCATFGNGYYSAKVAGTFVYNAQTGQLPTDTVNDVYITGCP